MNWTAYLFDLAATVANKSKDPATKVGCVIVGDDNEIVATGFNGLPIGVEDRAERLERPVKYDWTSHAEMNAIAFAARNGHRLKGGRLFSTRRPCAICARLIIQAGIREVHFPAGKHDSASADLGYRLACEMLSESGVGIFVHGKG